MSYFPDYFPDVAWACCEDPRAARMLIDQSLQDVGQLVPSDQIAELFSRRGADR